MFTFNKIKITQDDVNQMQVDLLRAVKYTCDIKGYNMYSQLLGTLHHIMTKKNYLYITSQNGFRELVAKHDSDKFFNYLVAYTKWAKDSDLSKISVIDGKYQIDDALLLVLTERMCQNYLNHLLKDVKVTIPENEAEVIYYKPSKPTGKHVEKVVYYEPSNKCREAIMNGNLSDSKRTSFNYKGMVGVSDRGKKRTNQEDAYYIGVHPSNDNFKIMIVCDGVGGIASGEIASNLAVKGIINWFENLDSDEFYSNDNDSFQKMIESEIRNIHQTLCRKTSGATTLCMSIIKNDCIIMVNIGDSKGYIIDNNRLTYTTYQEDMAHALNIPSSIARFYKDSNVILNCLGGDKDNLRKVNYQVIKIQDNHIYKVILCTDGVVDCLGDETIFKIAVDKKIANHAKALVDQALENPSYLKSELINLGFFARRRVDESQFNGEIPSGKDNTTAVYGVVSKR